MEEAKSNTGFTFVLAYANGEFGRSFGGVADRFQGSDSSSHCTNLIYAGIQFVDTVIKAGDFAAADSSLCIEGSNCSAVVLRMSSQFLIQITEIAKVGKFDFVSVFVFDFNVASFGNDVIFNIQVRSNICCAVSCYKEIAFCSGKSAINLEFTVKFRIAGNSQGICSSATGNI